MPKIRIGLVALRLIGAVAVAAAVAAAVAGCGSHTSARTQVKTRTTSQPSAQLPATPAGRQLAWALALVNSGKTPAVAELSTHFSPAFLKTFPPLTLLTGLQPIVAGKPYHYVRMLKPPNRLRLVVRLDGDHGASLRVSIDVAKTPAHRIKGLLIQTLASEPGGWRAIDSRLGKFAARPSMLAAEVRNGRLQTVHALSPNRVGAIGSSFKLYVLGALGQAIEDGKASWQEKLAIRATWKSIPSGQMQNEPAGKRFSLLRYAQLMIAISDNTATDHLIRRLGRNAVEKELVRFGNHSPERNTPFLTTREGTILKVNAPASLTDAYVRAGSKERSRLLKRVDAIPLSIAGVDWNGPRLIDSIEWFASPADLGRAMVGLQQLARRPKLAPIRPILAKNPGAPLDPKTWRYAAFKGGSEAGVVAFSWYLERRDGRAFVLAIVLNDSKRTLDDDLVSPVSIAQGAMTLLAHS
jgi:hypothetical protein